MSSGTAKKRSDRVSQLDLPPSRLSQALIKVRRSDVLWRIAVCGVTVLLMWIVTGGWRPSFPYRTYESPSRVVIAKIDFDTPNPLATKQRQDETRANFQAVYDNSPAELRKQREDLRQSLLEIVQTNSFDELGPKIMQDFVLAKDTAADEAEPTLESIAGKEEEPDLEQSKVLFEKLRAIIKGDAELGEIDTAITAAFDKVEQSGVLNQLQHDSGSQEEIRVRSLIDSKIRPHIPVEEVERDAVIKSVRRELADSLPPDLVPHISQWLTYHLPVTLAWNEQKSKELLALELSSLVPAVDEYVAGEDELAEGGKPLTAENIELLKREHAVFTETMSWGGRCARVAASFAMYLALYLLLGAYIYYREPGMLRDFNKFVRLQALVLLTVTFAKLCANDSWQAELVPLMLFAMTAAIAYRQEIALLLAAGICLIVVISLGQGLTELVILAATLSTTIILLRNVRSRTKLIYIGLAAGAVASVTALSVGIVRDPGFGGLSLLVTAGWYGLFAGLAGVLMTGILPFVETGMELQTDISLLELGDVAHPLLQELVRRAPGTYNHSINVASIAEAAAESIGANGLLVRVGAYFHDIGKMLKPQYFIENQGTDASRHEALLPAMSTLIIIAHVKDGADLARQHHLPRPLIDFILQHHGTTLVEFFYDRASKQSEEDPDACEVDETTYRYPGPKPQTREAAVLMLADAVESASRSLKDPAPSRIESLVHELASKRLLDGQFDECGLTFKQLRTVEKSIVKSLTAMYHGRVKYPDQQTA